MILCCFQPQKKQTEIKLKKRSNTKLIHEENNIVICLYVFTKNKMRRKEYKFRTSTFVEWSIEEILKNT